MPRKSLTKGQCAQQKAKQSWRWAQIMTKWSIARHSGKGVKWHIVEFGGKTGSESRGIVDLIAIRKNHRKVDEAGLKKGDLFDVILIQTKGGRARGPSDSDIERLAIVGDYYRAKKIVLAKWKKGDGEPVFQTLVDGRWEDHSPEEIFGKKSA